MHHELKSVDLPTHVCLEYVEQGPPSGEPVIFLHGLGDSCHSFELVLAKLPPTVRAYSISQRGHGGSSRPQGAYRFYDFAADVAAFMRALKLEGAVLVGHSLGSTVAQRFAIDHPELTRGLVLAGAFHDLPSSQVPRGLWSQVSDLHDPVHPGFVRSFQENTCVCSVPEHFFEETVLRESMKLPARVWQEVVGWMMQDGFHQELGRIEAPTWLLWGDRDPLVPRADQEALLGAIAGARLLTYEGHGHALPWEAPERLARDCCEFLQLASRRRGRVEDQGT